MQNCPLKFFSLPKIQTRVETIDYFNSFKTTDCTKFMYNRKLRKSGVKCRTRNFLSARFFIVIIFFYRVQRAC